MSNQPIFHDPALWAQYGLTPDYLERIQVVESLLPDDTTSILDVGCGKGDVLNAIHEVQPNIRLLGVDLSPEALSFAEIPAVVAGLPGIPLADRSFDLVLCLQVLEHIVPSDYRQSLRELERLADRHLIVGVPFAENLSKKQVLCARCNRVSHVDGHLRRFSSSDLAPLFQSFALERLEPAGVLQYRQPRVISWMRHTIAGLYYQPDLFVCPYCEAHENRAVRGGFRLPIGRPLSLLERLVHRVQTRQKYWMIVLFRRKGI
ncbi:MAG: class I SAM-dependent methyltransferase [Nitrospiraceae bacterium]|nr:class I SAM-dependent methyltransferase [Nitrospiraceae bacterium]